MIDLTLLVEETEKDSAAGKSNKPSESKPAKSSNSLLDRIDYKRQLSRGAPRKDIKDSTSRAQSEPKALLRDLGITKLSGSDPISQMASALQQALQENDTFRGAFGSLQQFTDNGQTVVTINPYVMREKYPQIYIGAIMLALQNIGALPSSLNPEWRVSGKKKDLNIRQTSQGTIVIADPTWHATRPGG